MHLITYNCIRSLMIESAEKAGVGVRSVSFKRQCTGITTVGATFESEQNESSGTRSINPASS
jgi:hypothetical protein